MLVTDTTQIPLNAATRRLLKDPDSRKAWAMYQLALRGRSMAAVAASAGVKPDSIYAVWHRPYPRLERAIAAAIGIKPEQLFPNRYDAAGKPARRMGRPPRKSASTNVKNNSRATTCNDKATDAA